MHDYDKVSEAIENDLCDLLEKSDLVPTLSWDNIYLKNVRYEMTWNHLFTRIGVHANAEGFAAVQAVLDREYDIKKQKIDYLIEKFKDLRRYRTLYIVAFTTAKVNSFKNFEPDEQTLLRLSRALEKIRGNDNFAILFCPTEKKFDSFDNIIVREIFGGHVAAHIGDFTLWNEVLMTIPFSEEKVENDTQGWANHMDW